MTGALIYCLEKLGTDEMAAADVLLVHPQREFFIDNLLVRIHLIIEISIVDRPCGMGV